MGDKSPIVKITIVGDGYIGKTCILIVFVGKEIPVHYIPTVFDNYSGEITVDGIEYKLKLWDTAGQEEYDRLRPLSYPGTTCVLICFAINYKQSYDNVKFKWYPEIQHHLRHVPIILVGTKSDLRYKEEDPNNKLLTEADGHRLKKEIKAVEYFECSAIEKIGLEDIFVAAVRHSRQNMTRRHRTCIFL